VSRRSWATIDLDALRHNLAQVREYAPRARIMAAIKADAYGHGAVEVARTLGAADALAVASLGEALELRRAGIDRPLVLLGGVLDADELYTAVEQGLQLVVHDFRQLSLIERSACAHAAAVWVKLDTGMHRLGFASEAMPELRRRLASLPSLHLQGWMKLAIQPRPGRSKPSSVLWRVCPVRARWPIPRRSWPGRRRMPNGCVPASCCTAQVPWSAAAPSRWDSGRL
jgi:D-serine deaminase-like pyridoxal phosphate-dependent protein